jgi:hypothetical protein
MSQAVVNELRQVYDLWQNGLTARSVYEAATKELLGKLVSDGSISLSDQQQGLKAAKQYVTNQSQLLEAGNKLVQMRLEHFSSGAAAGMTAVSSLSCLCCSWDFSKQLLCGPTSSSTHCTSVLQHYANVPSGAGRPLNP